MVSNSSFCLQKYASSESILHLVLALMHFSRKFSICKVKWVRKITLFDAVAEAVLVLYSANIRRTTELLERETEGLYFLYFYCERVANR